MNKIFWYKSNAKKSSRCCTEKLPLLFFMKRDWICHFIQLMSENAMHTFGRNFRNYEFNNVEYSADVMLNNPRYEFKWFWMFISFFCSQQYLTFSPQQEEQKTIRHILTSTTCTSCVEVVNTLQKMHENGRLALREFRRSKKPKKNPDF